MNMKYSADVREGVHTHSSHDERQHCFVPGWQNTRSTTAYETLEMQQIQKFTVF